MASSSSRSSGSSSPSRTTSAPAKASTPAPAPAKVSTPAPSSGTTQIGGNLYNSGGGLIGKAPSTPSPSTSSGGGGTISNPGYTPPAPGQTATQQINGQTVTTTNNNGNYTTTFANTGPTTSIGGNTYNSGGGLVSRSTTSAAPTMSSMSSTAYTPPRTQGTGSTGTLATQRGLVSSLAGGGTIARGEMGYSKQEKKKRDAARAAAAPASPVNEPGMLDPTTTTVPEAPVDPRDATMKALQDLITGNNTPAIDNTEFNTADALYNQELKAEQDAQQAYRLGAQNVSEQVIPMEFITGQQKSLEARANNNLIPIQNRVAMAQARRQAAIEGRTAAQKAAETSQTNRINAANVLLDYQGQIANQKSPSDTRTAEQKNFEFAQQNPQFLDYVRKVSNETNMSPTQTSNLMSISTKFGQDQVVNNANNALTLKSVAQGIIQNPTSAANQLTSLYTFVKALDPNSAVREGEVALAQQATSLINRVGTALTSVGKGQVINPQVAKELATAVQSLADSWIQASQRKTQLYKSQAATVGVGPQFDAILGGSQGYGQGGVTAQSAQKSTGVPRTGPITWDNLLD